MKENNHIALLFGWIAFALAPASASQAADAAQNGVVTGRVQLATGQYVNNATVAVKGTSLSARTDQFGIYRLANVPSGPVVIEVTYTGQERAEATLNLSAGGSLEHDVTLNEVSSDILKMQKFQVSGKEVIAEEIATHEQRAAPNIKNVISTDAYGDITGGTLGDFLKYMPGLTVEYSDIEVAGVSARGFGSAYTNYSSDGAPMAGGDLSATRRTRLNHLGLNNLARIEVTKVPTPANPADSLGGSVNMISKSSFDQAGGSRLNYGVSLQGNSDQLTLSKVPISFDRKVYLVFPAFTFDATWVINKNLGVVITGDTSHQYNEQHISSTTWNTGGTGTGASLTNPYFQSFGLIDGPRDKRRKSITAKVDWRVTPTSVLSFGAQANGLFVDIGTNTWTQNAGTTGTPTPTTGVPMTFGSNYTNGATGRGAVTFGHGYQKQNAFSLGTNARYRFDDGIWSVVSGLGHSTTRRFDRRADSGGYSGGLTISLRDPVRVNFAGITPDRPSTTKAYNNANQEIDLYNIDNYVLTAATSSGYSYRTGVDSADLTVKRKIGWLPFPTTIQTGALRTKQWMNGRRWSPTYTYNGLDGLASTLESPAPYLSTVFNTKGSPFGYKNVPWVSPLNVWDAWKGNPNLFSQTTAQAVAAETSRIANSLYVDETVSALYLQAEAKLLQNRLNVLGGVRHERTVDDGAGPLFDPNAVYVRNANGTLARTSAGALIRKPEAGAVGSMEELRLTRQERGARGHSVFADFFPSLHLTYNITDNFLARAAYAFTYGRPNFGDIIASTTIQENTDFTNPDALPGSITVTNPDLKPWTASNYDLSLEYYTPQGGLFSAGVFQKDIKNFFGSGTKIATAADLADFGLDPRYVGYELRTKFNAGDAKVSGVELSARHSLERFGVWGRAFSLFVNGTKLKLEGNQGANFSTFIPLTVNWGAIFRKDRVAVTVRWNHRGEANTGATTTFGPDGGTYSKAQTQTDLTFEYQINNRLSFTANARNIFNVNAVQTRYGSQTPGYAQQLRTSEYGSLISAGIKGSF
ncbi:MAG: TonB-dependent receptor [Opitutus sp.]|nr:TonB-dependent receptor [Opitutus sp.]